MTAKEMQRLSAQKRWGKMTPEERSNTMARIRAGGQKATRGMVMGEEIRQAHQKGKEARHEN